jgi:hypothetical protein
MSHLYLSFLSQTKDQNLQLEKELEIVKSELNGMKNSSNMKNIEDSLVVASLKSELNELRNINLNCQRELDETQIEMTHYKEKVKDLSFLLSLKTTFAEYLITFHAMFHLISLI